MQNQTINHLRHVLASQLSYGVKLEADLAEAVATINDLFDVVGGLVDHVNVFHREHGIEQIINPFEGLQYNAQEIN